MMSKRRKPVTCVLCAERETTDFSGVCQTCKNIYEFGKKTASRFEPDGDLTSVLIDRRLLTPTPYLGRPKEERRKYYNEPFALDHAIESAILNALGATADFRGQGSHQNDKIDVVNQREKYSAQYSALKVPKNKLVALKIFQVIADAMADAYDNGFRAGENLLAKLASGETTVRQYEEKKP